MSFRGGRVVGRDDELGHFDRLVRGVAAGRGGAIWVEGEAGIGKSALLAAGLSGAEGLGCQVHRAAADELGRRFPLQVMLDCLDVLPATTDPVRRPVAEALRVRSHARAAALDPVPAAAEELMGLLERLCARPLVLAVDDLQWADDASLLVWHWLGRRIGQLPLLLVAAHRPVAPQAQVARLRHQAADAGATMLELPPLPEEAVAELVADLTGAEAVGPRLRAAMTRAAGNPLYVREMVDALARERLLSTAGRTVELAGAAGTDAVPDVPMSLVAAISDRLGFLSEDTLSMLRAAALLGTEFTVTDLGVLIDRPAAELAPAVEEALRAGVLADAGSRLAFRHAVIRQVLYDATPAALRVALHQEAARSLAEAAAPADHVARQLLAALPGDDATATLDDWALDWLTGPGRTLVQRSPEVAAELLARAVGQAPPGDPRREDLQATLASVLMLTGRRDEAARLAEVVLTTTADPGRAGEVAWTLVWALLGLLRTGQAARALDDSLAGSVADVPGEPWALRLRAMRPFAAILDGEPAGEQEAPAAANLAAAESAGDELAIAVAGIASNVVHRYAGDIGGALAALDRTLPLVGGDPRVAELRLQMLTSRLSLLDSLDRLTEASAVAGELLVAADRYASPEQAAATRTGAAVHYWHAGRWDEAVAVLQVIAEDSLPIPAVFRPVPPGLAALIAARRDDPETARTHLASTADMRIQGAAATSYGQYLVLARAVLAERAGDPAAARDLLAGLAGVETGVSDAWLWLPWLVRLAVATGQGELARRAAAAVAGSAGSKGAAAAHCRGLLDDDPAALLAAADAFGGVGRPAERAAALEDAAVALGGRRDGAGARTAYAAAVGIYSGLGAEWDLRRAQTRVRPYALRRRGTRRPSTGWAALTPTELTVAGLVAEGHSNPDIADRLVLSRRTVDVHVSHVLAKLGVRSRVDIAREAFKHHAPTRSA